MKQTFKQFLILNEIYPGVEQDEKLFASYIKEIKNEELIGKAENHCSVYSGILDDKKVFVLRKDDEEKTFIGYLAGGYITIEDKKYWQSNYAYFDSAFRNKGYATSLFAFILKRIHIPIISDEIQSPDGRKLWKSLLKTFRGKIYDSDKHKFLNLNEVPENEIYTSDEILSNRYYLVLEKCNSLRISDPLSASGPSVLLYEQTRYTADSIIGTFY